MEDEYFYFKKQWRSERRITWLWLILLLTSYGIIFYIAASSSFYWIKNDMLTTMQFTKYFWKKYWYIVLVWIFSIYARVKCTDHGSTCKAFRRKWEIMTKDKKE